ncbi:MAG TPA: hypothetical protein ENJ95_16885 [Bacteroidetes bacterium]|nr:hypothetical protein [Bacteroidota bacterium]
MRNIVGQTPRGNDFFKRNHIIKKIYRRLEAGNHLFLSAPRRAGKTSIMRYLEDNPREGHAFVYINTEDVNDSEEFFRLVAEKLLSSKAVEKMTKAAESSKNVFKQFTENISKIKVWSFEVELNKTEAPKYKDELETLMRKLDTEDFKIIIMLDEFPVTIENIKSEHGEEQAVSFMHANRRIRQEAKRGIQFIYTGSIGLPVIAKRLKATATLNDLNVLEIPPLSILEATRFSQQIFDNYKVEYLPGVIGYMLEKLDWLMPFFIQLVIQKMIDEFDETGSILSKKSVDIAFVKSGTHRSNLYFDNYLSRLDKTLPEKEAKNAKHILKEVAVTGEIHVDTFDGMEGSKNILEMLELDGYLTSDGKNYRFSSPILGAWWKKHVS